MNKLLELHLSAHASMGERNNIAIPMSYHSGLEEYESVRTTLLLTDYSHFGLVSIDGDGAYELLNEVVAGNVANIRDEQGMYTVILDEQGQIVTDVYLLCDDERFVLMAEWLSGEQLCQLLESARQSQQIEEVGEIINLNQQQMGILHVEGPYCWEILAEMYGMDIVGLPFQEHMHFDEVIVFRSGKHGEFSYKIIATFDELAEIWQQLLELGEKYDLQVGGLNYQYYVRLENPCWQPDIYRSATRSPLEMQMQWMINYDKDAFTGKEALEAQLAQGITRRVIGLRIELPLEEKIAPKTPIYCGEQQIGELIFGDISPRENAYLGRAIIDSEYAFADVDSYYLQLSDKQIPCKTQATPFVRNNSFLVNPLEHSYVDKTRPRDFIEQLEWQKQENSH